jgi:hypothetical protein
MEFKDALELTVQMVMGSFRWEDDRAWGSIRHEK